MKYVYLLSATVLGGATQITLKYLSGEAFSVGALFNPLLLLVILSFGLGSFFWLISLRYFELGIAYLVNSFSIVLTYAYSVYFFGEIASWNKNLGILFILVGIFFVNKKLIKS